MEDKLNAMYDMVKNLTTELNNVKADINTVKTEMNNRFETMDNRFNKVDERFDAMDNRFDTLEEKVDNLSSESRSYFKRLEEKTDTHEFVIQKLSYQTNANEGRIAEMQERFKDD